MTAQMNEPVSVERDCEAILIPDGTAIEVPQGSVVFITQALGGNYTINLNGNLAQIGAKDADALGFDIPEDALIKRSATRPDGTLNEDLVWAQMRTCYDPEIPINVVELGLIYDCQISALGNGDNRVDILMTLTAPGCGMGEFLAADVHSKVAAIPGVTEVDVQLTFDPPWSMGMMTEAARLESGLFQATTNPHHFQMALDWTDVATVEELGPGKSHFIEVGEITIAVFNLDGEYFAVEDACSHDGSRMLSCGVEAKFIVHGERIMCPRHGAEFCIRTGDALSPPARDALATFPVRVAYGKIQVNSQSNP